MDEMLLVQSEVTFNKPFSNGISVPKQYTITAILRN